METERRRFLEALLATASPSGFETPTQRVWIDQIEDAADSIRTDDYGNAVAVHNEGASGPSIVLAGHVDEIGFIVQSIDEDGFLHVQAIGGADRTVSQGQGVEIHTDTGAVSGVVGQTAIHLRDRDEENYQDIEDQYIDIGARNQSEARDLVEIGDPVTIDGQTRDLSGSRLAAKGLDDRVGVWAAALAFEEIVDAGTNAELYAVSTVQEEVGLRGAEMVGFGLDPDVVVAVDVDHAVDTPGITGHTKGETELGAGPTIGRGSVNHPVLVDAMRSVAAQTDVAIQMHAAGSGTRTDADRFATAREGIPTVAVGIPTRYMHTPVEVVDCEDLAETVELLAEFVDYIEDTNDFAVTL